MKRKGYRVIPQMFDVKPVNESGGVNVAKIKQISQIVRLEKAGKEKLSPQSDPYSQKKPQRISSIAPKRFGMSSRPNPSGQKYFARKLQQDAPIFEKVSLDPQMVQLNSYFAQGKETPSVFGLEAVGKLSKEFLWQLRRRRAAAARPTAIEYPAITIKGIEHQSIVQPQSERIYKKIILGQKQRKDLVPTSPPRPVRRPLPANLPQRNIFPAPIVAPELPVPIKREQYTFYQEPGEYEASRFVKEKEDLIKDFYSARKRQPKPQKRIHANKDRAKKQAGFNFREAFFANYKKIAGIKATKYNTLLRPALGFTGAIAITLSVVWASVLVSRGLQLKDSIVVKGQSAIGYLAAAKEELKGQNFQSADQKFQSAQAEFAQAEKQINSLGGDLLNVFAKMPYLSKVASGKNIIESGKKMTQAASKISQAAQTFSQIESPFKADSQAGEKTLIDVLVSVNDEIVGAKKLLEEANDNLARISEADLPSDYQSKFVKIKEALPVVIGMMDAYEENYQIFLEILGHQGPRKYFFVFQNNQEMRATGGFIGSYGILDINNGQIKNLFIDGIYNPDGQLWEKVVPPKPVQKISAAWSTHDANWFPHFPTSAEKIAWFYEKTGGPTVDGVISLTPTVLQKMLEITGPIEMPEYETVVDKDNFVEKTQYEVEIDFDKEANRPKQFIADLAPKILDEVLSVRNPDQISKVMSVMTEALSQKHILIYSFNYNVQQIVSKQGWSGEVLRSSKDYLMVVNSNINGFKTDGVIDETITHKAEVQPDGSIIDTVKVKRSHKGGETDHDWWNKVNSDYMRVYVPKGSQLIEVKGQTREFNQPPLDYDSLGFRRDPQVEQEEQNMKIDEATGTRIYEEEEKTVFANWVYVSPKETVEIEYKYLLPFTVDLNKNRDKSDTYSILFQKQSGSISSKLESEVVLSNSSKIIWKYPEAIEINGSAVKYNQDLSQDRFMGFVLQGESTN